MDEFDARFAEILKKIDQKPTTAHMIAGAAIFVWVVVMSFLLGLIFL